MKRARNRRGVTMIVFILMIAVFAGYFMMRHMFSAVQKSKQSVKLFHSTSAMNLAEACIGAALNATLEGINAPDDSPTGFYLLFRLPVDKLRGRSVSLLSHPAVKEIVRSFGGSVEKLEVRFGAVAPFVDKAGSPVSLDNVEKCGAVIIECHARIADSLVRVETRHDFKVAVIREPRLHHYALAVRDAWGEYAARPSTKYASTNYTGKPGSWEGYNPVDRHLRVTSASNGYSGKVLLNGPSDPDKKIILNLSDADTDLMKPLHNIRNKHFIAPTERWWRHSGVDKDLPRPDAEKLWNATFTRGDFTKDPFGPDYKSSVYFSKQNFGYRSKYRFKKLDDTWSTERDSMFFPNEASTTDPDKWKNLAFLFGAPTFFYESAVAALAEQYGHDQALWTHHRDRADRGLDLWGEPGERTPCPVEGNVFVRHTSLAYLLWRIEPEGGKYDLYAPFPGSVNLIPAPNDPKDPRNVLDFQVYGALRARIDDATSAAVFTPQATKDRADGLKDKFGNKINCDSEVHVVPYNLMLYHLKMNDDSYKDFPDYIAASGAENATLAPAIDFDAAIANYTVMNKFTAIYDEEKEFFADRMTLDPSTGRKTLHLDGKMLVIGSLHLDKGPYQYKGAGTIVTLPRGKSGPADIHIGSSIGKSPDAGAEDTCLTLVATYGKIFIAADNLRTECALFALSPGFKPGEIETQSFLIGPNKEIQQARKWQLVGALAADRLNLPSLHQSVEIVYDPDLAPALTDETRHRDYHVSVSRKTHYWYRGNI